MSLAEWVNTLGTIIAVAISWSVNQSILWAVLHGIFGWFYVIYYAFWGSRFLRFFFASSATDKAMAMDCFWLWPRFISRLMFFDTLLGE